MALISKLDISNGSLLDIVTGNVATKTGTSIKFTDSSIGIVLSNNATTGNYVDITGSETFTNTGDWSLSIPFFVKNNNGAFISKLNATSTSGWGLRVEDNTTFRFFYGTGTGISASGTGITLPNAKNKWHYVIIVYSSGKVYIYVDNITYLNGYTLALLSNTDKIRTHRLYTSTSGFEVNGSIGTPKIYNHALSVQERERDYKEYLNYFPKGLQKVNPIAYPELKSESLSEVGLVCAYTYKRGSLLDVSGNSYHGTKVSNPIIIPEGLRFDGVDDVINMGDIGAVEGINTLTIATRFKCRSGSWGTWKHIVSKSGAAGAAGDSWALGRTAVGINTFFYVSNGSTGYVVENVTPPLGTWIDVVAIVNVNTLQVYVNGVLAGSGSFSGNINSTTKNLKIGGSDYSGGYAACDIEEVKIYNVAKSAAWVADYHNKFAKRLTLIDPAIGEAVGNAPKQWQGIGTTLVSGSYVPNIVWDEWVLAKGELQNNITGWSSGSGWTGTSTTTTAVNVDSYNNSGINSLAVYGRIYNCKATIQLTSGYVGLYIGGDGFWSTTTPGTYNININVTHTSGTVGRIYAKGNNFGGLLCNCVISNVIITEIPPLPELKNAFKLHKCNVADVYSIPSKQAYGTWRLKIYKALLNSEIFYHIIANNDKYGLSSGALGYSLRLRNDNSIRLMYHDGVADNNYVLTVANYIQPNTLYEFIITRNPSAGVWLFYVRGGSYTSITYFGTATDNNIKTCNKMIINNAINDKFVLGQCTEGIIV